MSLAKPLPAVRKDLRETLISDLPAAVLMLDELLPDGSEKKAVVTALRAALNQLNKDNFRGIIDPAAFAQRLAQISANFTDFLDTLTEADFEPPVAPAKSGQPDVKRGSVLYRIPLRMPIRKPSICTVRVAVDEEAIFDDLMLDDGVRLRQRVEVSERMSAELVDTEGNVFDILPFNSSQQKVRDTGYTQWLFRVTPRIEGEHQLLVKVSLLEFDPNTQEYLPREVSILETVTIVTEAPAPSDSDETPLRDAGHQFALSPAQPASASPQRSTNKPLRAAALFFAFLLFGTSATWAITPPVTRDWWVAALRDSAEGYTDYIEKHHDSGPTNPRLETAYFRIAEKTDSLADLRRYQEHYRQGNYAPQVTAQIRRHEMTAVASLRQQPQALKVRQFLTDYPDATRLPEVKQVVEQLPATERSALLPALETAYVRTMQVQPAAQKFEQYRRDYPQVARLTEMAEAAATASPEVLQAVQPALDEVIVQKMQAATRAEDVQAVLPALKAAGSQQAAERVEQLVADKPAPVRRQVAAQVQEARVQVTKRGSTSVGVTPNHPDTNAATAEDRDWAAAVAANTLQGYADFVNKYRNSAHRAEERTRVRALRPNMTSDEQAWADADLDNTPEGYIYFVQKNPRSPQADEARRRIKTFSLNAKERKRLETEAAERVRREAAATTEKENGKDNAQDIAKTPDAPLTSEKEALPQNRKSGIYNMKSVPGGTFTMGSPESEKYHLVDECQHTVTVATFSIGKYEVTQADWREIMGSDPPRMYNNGCDDCPVEGVSWDEVQVFLKKINRKAAGGKKYRLPTEAEWEYAARGGAKSKGFQYAGSNNLGEVAWYDHNYEDNNIFGSKKTTRPVGMKKTNELGLYDMSGNVEEWCADVYEAYPGCARIGTISGRRVFRGGAWNLFAGYCRVSSRSGSTPEVRNDYLGFRLVSSPQ